MEGFIPVICAMKIAATASYKAVPSMLIVAPIGNTKREIRGSILLPWGNNVLEPKTKRFSKTCSKLLIVIGRVAELEAVPKAVARAGPMDPMNLEVGEVQLLLTRCLCGCLPEWQLSSDQRVDDGQDDEALGGDAKADRDQVPADNHKEPYANFPSFQTHDTKTQI